jgi:hypothetical protein
MLSFGISKLLILLFMANRFAHNWERSEYDPDQISDSLCPPRHPTLKVYLDMKIDCI